MMGMMFTFRNGRAALLFFFSVSFEWQAMCSGYNQMYHWWGKSCSRRFKVSWPLGGSVKVKLCVTFQVWSCKYLQQALPPLIQHPPPTNRRLQSQMMLTKHFSPFVINYDLLLLSVTFCMMCTIAQSLNRVNSDSGTFTDWRCSSCDINSEFKP